VEVDLAVGNLLQLAGNLFAVDEGYDVSVGCNCAKIQNADCGCEQEQ
jgi:hypothetical protein